MVFELTLQHQAEVAHMGCKNKLHRLEVGEAGRFSPAHCPAGFQTPGSLHSCSISHIKEVGVRGRNQKIA